HETQKILQDKTIGITATVVRVPVMGGHSESVNAEFYKDFELAEVKSKLQEFPGLVLQDNPRIRRDQSQEKTLNMWIVSDNLRKGAATNAIQIASYIAQEFLNITLH
ncbi:MAG: aspartate-semialdehyde dehydrogenase, partial [Bacteroidetes bacterium 4572_77]